MPGKRGAGRLGGRGGGGRVGSLEEDRRQPAGGGGGGGGSGAARAGCAARLKRRRTWEMQAAQPRGTAGGGGCADPGEGLRAPRPARAAAGGSRRPLSGPRGREEGARGWSPRPAASPRPLPSALRQPSPPVFRLPLSLRPQCPEAGRAPPLPLRRSARPLAGCRGSRRGPRRRRGLPTRGRPWLGSGAASPGGAGLSQLPAEAAVLPRRRKLASPYCGAGRAGWCQQGCVFAALRWPLRYTFESLTGRLSVNTGCASEQLSRGGVCSFWSIEPGKRTG